jgi:N6-L-threonylcarbamoyladenine synthase
MIILGIETSCDDTSIGIVEYRRGHWHVLANITASQVIHKKYGGVVPEVAAREHALTIIPTIEAALRRTGFHWKNIDRIAVTAGPGLQTALLVGVEAARTLSWLYSIPLVAVNHIEGHVVSAFAGRSLRDLHLPAVALIVSGGHTELISIKKFGSYQLLGKTIDDALGEAFDKTAKVLGLPYPGGPEISRLAAIGNPSAYAFPRAIMEKGNMSFSYAGLKTAVLYAWEKERRISEKKLQDICASFEVAALDPIIEKTRRALQQTTAKTLLLGGGVAANRSLRQRLQESIEREFPATRFLLPEPSLCTDNGAMIAIAGSLQRKKTSWKHIEANPAWELV